VATRGLRSRATPGSATGRPRVPRGEAVVHHQADGLAEPALVRGIGARPDLPSDPAMCPPRGAPASQASTTAWTRSLGLSLKGEPGSLLRQRHDDAGSNIGGYSCTRWCRGAQDRSDQSGVSMAPDSMRATASVARARLPISVRWAGTRLSKRTRVCAAAGCCRPPHPGLPVPRCPGPSRVRSLSGAA